MRPAFVLLAVFVLVPAPTAFAQHHFTDCAERTAHNATLILPEGTASLDTGDEIAVFSPRGRCAGAAMWHGEALALTLWGHDAGMEGAGLAPGDSLRFRLWDASAKIEYNAGNSQLKVALATGKPHLETCLCYRPNAIYVVERLRATLTRQVSRQSVRGSH